MGKKKSKSRGGDGAGWTDADDGPLNNPFAKLAAARGVDPAPKPEPKREPADDAAPGPRSPLPKRAVVRVERKGRAGKTVTLVTHLDLSAEELDAWCSRMRSALGCGGTVEGDQLVLQGDQRDRAAEWLRGEGVARVS